ncbi:Cobalamin synthase [hydrothermal vent metagenome]|uniref:Adenosylcobinamide-GDP ribazoletransferase n=1 Tax=hydrothermal vent metagenome TaxID=652676 RepID=A0A3B1CT77_9ZZZZ
MKRLLFAVGFLTIFPLPERFVATREDMGGAALYFVPVGVIIGLALITIDYGLGLVLPPLPVATLLVIAMIMVSGALHMDGLGDTADGFFSPASRERVLEIMKDSRLGSMGAIAIVSVFVLKVSSLASMGGGGSVAALFLAPVAGRCAMVASLSLAPNASSTNGLGTIFTEKKSPANALWAALFLFVTGLITAGAGGIVIFAVTAMVVFAFERLCRARIGGMTGDNHGALCELAETAALLSASATLAGGMV